MPSLHEVALLIAFTSPVIVVAAINVFLAIKGEVDTLLIPRPMRFDAIAIAEEPVAAKSAPAKPVVEESFAEAEMEPLRAAA
jgi:hypothetical protein